MTRRHLLLAPVASLLPRVGTAANDETAPEAALRKLEQGNRRFSQAMAAHPDQSTSVRMALSSSQHPFAVVLTCSDSRVAPELIFDQGLGDLFVVRVAGNIADDAVMGSIEYAVLHLQTPLVFVLGHARCGAVEAALGNTQPEAHIATLVRAIAPAADRARRQSGDVLDHTIRENVRRVAARIREAAPAFRDLIRQKKLAVVGGHYELSTGIVTRLD